MPRVGLMFEFLREGDSSRSAAPSLELARPVSRSVCAAWSGSSRRGFSGGAGASAAANCLHSRFPIFLVGCSCRP